MKRPSSTRQAVAAVAATVLLVCGGLLLWPSPGSSSNKAAAVPVPTCVKPSSSINNFQMVGYMRCLSEREEAILANLHPVDPSPSPTTTPTPTTTAPTPTPTTTAPTPTPTTTAPTPTPTAPTPVPTAWPDASNTGVQDGVALTNRGSLIVNTAGAVIENLNIAGSLEIRAANVTVRNVRVRNNDFYTVRVAASGARLENMEIDGTGNGDGNGGIGGGGRDMTVLHTEIWNTADGIVPGSGSVLRDNWVHALRATNSPHYDGIQMDGGLTNIRVEHNHVDMSEHGQTGAVMVDNYFGAISGIVVDNNLLRGGGYTAYADGRFNSNSCSVTYSNNVFQRGQWGYLLAEACAVTWTNNTDRTTGAVIPR